MRKRYLRRNLRIARAARTLVRSEHPFRNIELCSLLEKTDLGLPSNAFVRLGPLAPAARACLRQRLMITTVHPRLLRELMCALANPAVAAPVTAPKAWRRVLVARGVHVRSDSRLRWIGLVMLLWAQGIYATFKRLRDIFSNRISPAPGKPYAVLMNVMQNMIPRRAGSFDFVSWYMGSRARPSDVREVWAHTTVKTVNTFVTPGLKVTRDYLPALPGYWPRVQCCFAFLWTIFSSTVRGVFGQWWEVVMLEQFVDLVYVRHLRKPDFASAYVFNNAWFILRPMWTYLAEDAGSKIALAFYGTNIELFNPGHSAVPVSPGYAGMTWQHYFVWDEIQAEFLRNSGVKDPATVVGPTGFADSDTVPEEFRKPYIVVFDVTPQNALSLAHRGIPQLYYNDEVWWQFMSQVQAALARHNFCMVYKKKRELGRRATALSRHTIEHWSTRDDVITVDPDVAPQRLIRDAAGVISLPFTSPALIARSMAKPTVFYDPLGVLMHERRLAHDIEVIGGPGDLDRWLAKLPKAQMVRQPVS